VIQSLEETGLIKALFVVDRLIVKDENCWQMGFIIIVIIYTVQEAEHVQDAKLCTPKRQIIKIPVIRYHILSLKCTNSDFC